MAVNSRCLIEAELRARADYAAPGRHYHTPDHLDDCLAQAEARTGMTERERRLLRWAILWHDAIYDPRRGDNEQRSAVRARSDLLSCGVAAADAEEVARLILLTRSHVVTPDDQLGALLVAIDLSILGAEPARYQAYVDSVRLEYNHLSDTDWRTGRAAVLEHLLATDPLFVDRDFHARFEEPARRNLEAELRGLREG